MKLNEMCVVITGENGSVASELISYFSNRAAFVVGTVQSHKINVENANNLTIIERDPLDNYSIASAIKWVNNQAGNIDCWLNIIGGFSRGHHVGEVRDEWGYMYNTNL